MECDITVANSMRLLYILVKSSFIFFFFFSFFFKSKWDIAVGCIVYSWLILIMAVS